MQLETILGNMEMWNTLKRVASYMFLYFQSLYSDKKRVATF